MKEMVLNLGKKEKLISFFFLLMIILPAVFRLIRPGFFSMYDDMQVIRLKEMDICVKDGQIPCRWVPDLGYGYGYPLFQYYAPLPYYVMEIFHLGGFSLIGSVKIGFILSVLLSAMFFFPLARRFFSEEASLISTALYIYLPIRLTDLYIKGAMGELWGLAILPLFFWRLDCLLKKRSLKNVIVCSLAGSLFLISHNLTVLQSIPLVFIWMTFRNLSSLKSLKKDIKYYLLALLLSFSLAAFYILPLVLERNLVYLETLKSGYFNYINHFVSLKQLLLSTKWGYGPSIIGANDDTSLSAGPIQVLIVLLALFPLTFSSKIKKQKYFWLSLIFFYWLSLYMTHSRSIFIWKTLPFLAYLQFPFRFLIIAGFTGCFISGVIIDLIPKKWLKTVVVISIIFLVIFYRQFLSPKDWFTLTDQEKLSGESYQRQITASIYDFLPKSAQELPKEKAPDSLIVKDGNVFINKTERGSNWYYYNINVVSSTSNVTIPTYDFPKWEIKVNGKKYAYQRGGELGLLGMSLSKGNYEIYAYLKRSQPRLFGDIISSLSVIFISVIFIKESLNQKSV